MVNPYNAIIIAHERMNIYAYISILEAILKLAIVYMIMVSPFDKLISYGFLLLLVSLTITMIYRIYSMRHYPESRYKFINDKSLFKELMSYSGWNLFGSASSLVKGQGLNILLNMFFNPSVNAARGIAYQINAHITMFFSNFYTAVRPQITKYYAQGDLTGMFKLVFRSSKMAFYLLFIISLPIIIETPYIVTLWLGQLPEYVVLFVRFIVVISIIDSMASPLMTTAHATGRIALYQSTVGTMTILNIPISYCLLKYLNCEPVIVFQVSLCIAIICLFMRLWIVNRLVSFPVLQYIKEVLGSCLLTSFVSIIIPWAVFKNVDETLSSVILVCILCILCTIISVYFIGLKADERTFIKQIAFKKLMHKK